MDAGHGLLLDVGRVGEEVLDLKLPIDPHLGESEIRQFDVALGREQNVVGLEIPMDDVVVVEVGQRQGDLRDIKSERICNLFVFVTYDVLERFYKIKKGHFLPGHGFVEESVHGEERLEVPTDQILHDEEDVVLGLEAVVQIHAERRLGDGQGVALGNHLTAHVFFHHVRLLHDFDGQHLFFIFAAAQEDFPEGPFADGLQDIEVLDRGTNRRGGGGRRGR